MKRLIPLLLGLFLATALEADNTQTEGRNSGGVTTSSQVIGLWTGTCDLTTFLRADGACVAVSGSGTLTSAALTMPSVFTVSGSPITSSGTFAVGATGTSGGLPYFSSSTAMASSAALAANQLMIGGGAGVAPSSLGSLGTTTTVYHGNASGAGSFGPINLSSDVSNTLQVAQMPAFTGDVTNAGGASLAMTIAPAAVSFSKQANLAAASLVGNNTSIAATPAALNALAAANLMSAVFSVTAASTSNITLSGTQTIDGQPLGVGQTELAIGQSTSSQDGIWIVQSGAWTRATNWPSGYVLAANCDIAVFVRQGTANQGHTFRLNTGSAITIDATAEAWADATASGSGGSSGTVTSASVVTANGLSGSVATPGTTPAITLSVTPTGPLKGSAGAIASSAAADITGIFGAGCNSGTYLKGDGTCGTAAGYSQISYNSGNLTAAITTFSGFHKVVKASTIDALEASAAVLSCTTNPTVAFYDCGTSANCASISRSLLGNVTLTTSGSVADVTIVTSTIPAGDYVAFEISAGACSLLNYTMAAQVHTN